MEKLKEYTNPEYYENRELSWIKFNGRVLNEARDKSIPLLERLKFVSITSSNLDEFFMVRVASLKDMVHAGYKKTDIAGMTASEQLAAINHDTRELVELQYSTYNRSLIPLLNARGIYIVDAYEDLEDFQAEYVDRYFEENVYPVLTPMAVDASRPFPLIRNKTLNIVALLEENPKKDDLLGKAEEKKLKAEGKKGGTIYEYATVQVPSVLPRLIPIPSVKEGEKSFILLEQIIEKNISKLFLGHKVVCAYPYRIMRNADLSFDEDEAEDLLKEIEKSLKKRQWGEVIRLEGEYGIDKRLLAFLKDELRVESEDDIFKINGPIDLTYLMKMYGLEGCDDLRYKPYTPQPVPQIQQGESIFDAIKKVDILLPHPYQTFDPVVEFIRQAAKDPDVLAIKQTLYRVSGNSPIIASLAQAAENGKQVTLDPEGKSNNPYWIINKNKFTNNLDRMIGNITLTYKPIEGLTITNNAGTDFYTEGRRKVYAKGTVGALNGKFQTWNLYKRIINNDLMVSYEKTFANDYHFKAMVGHNLYQEEWKNENVQAQNLVVDGLYTYTNAKSTTPVNYYEKKRLVGLYGDISLGYKDMLFVNVTGRNDWSSTLPINNRSYFYPSISGSFIFTELMENKDILNYGKIRLSYANVGSDEDPYNLAFKYTPASTYFLQYLGNVNTFPHMGLVGFTGPRVLPNENLKPQNQSSFEVGADLRFFGGKIRLDMTYYSNITKNQIVSIDVPLSTGYFANNINAGKIANKGVEVTLGLTPVETRNFKWDLDATFASNKQTVEELAEGLDEYTLTSGLSGLQIKAAKGDSFGLYGTAWKRDDQGNYVINSKTGLRETVNNVRLGDVYPDFTMGINNTLTYKGLTFSFLIDIRHGGSLYSETVANLRSSGLAAETVAHREDASFIEPGVILQDDGTYRPNDVPVKSMQDYWQHVANSSNNEGNIYNASFVKLREVQLSYSFPRKWFKSFFVKSLDLGFEARNLWIIKDHVPHIDPEANFFGPSQIGGGVEFNSIPSTRSFGFNLRLTL